MDITLVYFDGCPNWMLARDRLAAAMRRAGFDERSLRYRDVTSPAEAEAVGVPGSPTILIDGLDPFAGDSAPVGYACRLYRTPEGAEGAPSLEQLIAVLSPGGTK